MLPLSMPEKPREKMLDPRNSFDLIFSLQQSQA